VQVVADKDDTAAKDTAVLLVMHQLLLTQSIPHLTFLLLLLSI
jgi:hypothetical protein